MAFFYEPMSLAKWRELVRLNLTGMYSADLNASLNGTAKTEHQHKNSWLNSADGYLVLNKNVNVTLDNSEELQVNSKVAANDVVLRGAAMMHRWISQLLRAMVMFTLCTACIAQTKVDAHYLVDESTGKPLMTRTDGRPEVFFSSPESPTLRGLFTKERIDREANQTGEKFPVLVAGARVKIRDKDQWVRVKECCQDYSWIAVRNLPGRLEYSRDISRWLNDFGFNPDGQPERLNAYCVPLTFGEVFIHDPVTHKLRWTKFYAVARKEYDGAFRGCPEREEYVYSFAELGMSYGDGTVAVSVKDASPVNDRNLLVDEKTGEIVGPNPGGFKAIDAIELLRYKDEFLRKNTCPLLTASDKARYPTRPAQGIHTQAGRCYLDRLNRYEHDVIRHFFGEPTEPLEQK